MIILAYIFSGLSLLMGVLFFIQAKPPPSGFYIMFTKLAASALSPFWAIGGILGACIGIIQEAYLATVIGGLGSGMMILYVLQSTRNHKGFEKAFGAGWANHITAQQTKRMLSFRFSPFFNLKASGKSSWERDIPFWTIPGTDRKLLCDIWRPKDENASGLAFIYFHGSAWVVGDKDMMTRHFFRHLVAQGHTVMDVAYRLCPEVDIYGMVGDVKHAVAWMKTNASQYGVNPEKIVIGGGSAGAHLALLAAYTPQHPTLTPEDIKGSDQRVIGVVSFYGPSDMLAEYKLYMWKKFYSEAPPLPIGTILEPKMRWKYAGRLDMLLVGHPEDSHDIYQLASPITHVNSDCPPTLLMQGTYDLLVPIESTRRLNQKLLEYGVPVINVEFPWTDHAFDLIAPWINPAAQSAIFDVDRFLALLLNKD